MQVIDRLIDYLLMILRYMIQLTMLVYFQLLNSKIIKMNLKEDKIAFIFLILSLTKRIKKDSLTLIVLMRKSNN